MKLANRIDRHPHGVTEEKQRYSNHSRARYAGRQPQSRSRQNPKEPVLWANGIRKFTLSIHGRRSLKKRLFKVLTVTWFIPLVTIETDGSTLQGTAGKSGVDSRTKPAG